MKTKNELTLLFQVVVEVDVAKLQARVTQLYKDGNSYNEGSEQTIE